MKVNLFEYELPPELIAQQPAGRRAEARMLVLHRDSGEIEHRHFRDIPQYLREGDCLVINDTKVIPARLIGRRASGGRVEMLLLRPLTVGQASRLSKSSGRARRPLHRGGSHTQAGSPCCRDAPQTQAGSPCHQEVEGGQAGRLPYRRRDEDRWEVLVRSARRVKVGETVEFGPRLSATVQEERPAGVRVVALQYEGELIDVLAEVGLTPLPPYIHRDQEPASEASSAQSAQEAADRQRYQTVYAEKPGAVAAPTAGLHFDEAMLEGLAARGVRITPLTLHTGAGTFRPVKADRVENHAMEAEYYQISPESAAAINECREAGGSRDRLSTRSEAEGRIIAVGTTVVRALATAADDQGRLAGASGWSDLFIYPGYQFKVIDALLTNFHLPRSTLLMLVCAFAGREPVLAAYREAVEQEYRFYSYGDCMLIV